MLAKVKGSQLTAEAVPDPWIHLNVIMAFLVVVFYMHGWICLVMVAGSSVILGVLSGFLIASRTYNSGGAKWKNLQDQLDMPQNGSG